MVSLAPPMQASPAVACRWTSLAAPAIAGLLIYALVLLAPQVLNDGDSWWHVAAGGWMLDHGQVLRTDPFSYTFAGRHWHAHEWLAEVLMALAWRAAGWSGVVLLYAVAAGAAIAIVAHRAGRSLPPLSLAITLMLAVGCMAPSLLARPHLLALPLLAGWVAGLLKARDDGRAPPLALAALMIPWANMHGGYFLGLALIGPFALEALLASSPEQRLRTIVSWGGFGLVSLAACLVTPFALSGLLFPFQLLGMTSLAGVTEWRPTDFSRIGGLEVALVAGLFVMLGRGVRIPLVRLALVLLLVHMALHHLRHQILLGVVAPMLLAEPLARALSDKPGAPSLSKAQVLVTGCAVAALILGVIRLTLPVVRSDGPNAPVAAVAQLPPELRTKPVFNEYGFGGYLISQGVRPFIDGRTDMYGDAFTNGYFRAAAGDPAALDRLFARWNVAWTLLPPADPVVPLMDRRPGWRRLYSDRYAVVHVRADALPR